eukprot:2437314-Rhodomonas_salina.5
MSSASCLQAEDLLYVSTMCAAPRARLPITRQKRERPNHYKHVTLCLTLPAFGWLIALHSQQQRAVHWQRTLSQHRGPVSENL